MQQAQLPIDSKGEVIARTDSAGLSHDFLDACRSLGRSPHRPIAHLLAGLADFVGEEPVAELGVVAVGVEDGLGEVPSSRSASVTVLSSQRW
jgi:hypothetical protein